MHSFEQKVTHELCSLKSGLNALALKAEVDRSVVNRQIHVISGELRSEITGIVAILNGTAIAENSKRLSSNQQSDSRLVVIVECKFQEEDALGGILAWIHSHGCVAFVNVTASGTINKGCFGPSNAADVRAKSTFVSFKGPNQWIAYDFRPKWVRLTHYAIRSRFDGFRGCNHLKSWIIEGSEYGEDNWIEIDVKVDNGDLNNGNIIKVWEIGSDRLFRMIRLRQTGPSHAGKLYLVVSSFELFGSLLEERA
jgi:hypothetical protein